MQIILHDHGCSLSLLQPSSVLPRPLSIQIKRLIWDFAGVRSGSKWQLIEVAEANLHCLVCEYCEEIAVGPELARLCSVFQVGPSTSDPPSPLDS